MRAKAMMVTPGVDCVKKEGAFEEEEERAKKDPT
jgi:hypothetical protein